MSFGCDYRLVKGKYTGYQWQLGLRDAADPLHLLFYYIRQGHFAFVSVCLSQDNSKSSRRILMNFFGGVGCVTSNS